MYSKISIDNESTKFNFHFTFEEVPINHMMTCGTFEQKLSFFLVRSQPICRINLLYIIKLGTNCLIHKVFIPCLNFTFQKSQDCFRSITSSLVFNIAEYNYNQIVANEKEEETTSENIVYFLTTLKTDDIGKKFRDTS
jgi:hypothetical protein